ncbi:MAG: metal-dependent transcriptional regulator, partial [candidate division WOR-3 bacterium]
PMSLGESQEDYLEAILILEKDTRTVRVKDIAGLLGVSRPSVVVALAALADKGLVRHEHYGGVELTPKGRNVAETVYQRHQLLVTFLRRIVGVSAAVAEADACRLEHSLSPVTVKRLRVLISRMNVSRPGTKDE